MPDKHPWKLDWLTAAQNPTRYPANLQMREPNVIFSTWCVCEGSRQKKIINESWLMLTLLHSITFRHDPLFSAGSDWFRCHLKLTDEYHQYLNSVSSISGIRFDYLSLGIFCSSRLVETYCSWGIDPYMPMVGTHCVLEISRCPFCKRHI